MSKKHLAAACGLYCGACSFYLATRNQSPQIVSELKEAVEKKLPILTDFKSECDGCLAGERLTLHCRGCNIRLCAEQKLGVTQCADCKDFPCSLITGFNYDGFIHHAEVLENLVRMREIGVENWVRE